jgi:hypothetical protein
VHGTSRGTADCLRITHAESACRRGFLAMSSGLGPAATGRGAGIEQPVVLRRERGTAIVTRRAITSSTGIPANLLAEVVECLDTVTLPVCQDELLVQLLQRRAPARVLQILAAIPRGTTFGTVDDVLVEVVRRLPLMESDHVSR